MTGGSSPEGDPFDIDYVAHEMGHQYGARHTQNNNCNRSSLASYEPGSASTIMGYAGICNPNVQSNSDPYFHAISLQEMGNFTTGSGNSCANIIDTNNSAPTADAGNDYTIPISTPFVLSGIGTDVDGDPLSYCWEQWDREVAPMPPETTSTSGPMFRSFEATTSPDRYFPRLSVLAGPGTDTWEVLPSVARDMDFRLTVRDNNSSYGCTEEDNMTVSTTASAGPFLVTYPNDELSWNVGTTETITWDVANTDIAPVSCANIDIFYSVDGGLTFSNTLVTGVANDGSHDITVPNVTTSQFRIMIKCADNIFFDISDMNVSIGVEIECQTFTSVDVPVTISSSGTPTETSDLSITLDETIVDLNVLNLEGTHTWLGDLRFRLTSPEGTQVTLVNRECGNNDDFDVNFDDDGSNLDCPYNDGQTAIPAGLLSQFNGEDPTGDWVLEIADLANQDGGQLDAWSIEVCYEQVVGPLPLDYVSFDAIPLEASIALQWITANEYNNRGFQIERSTNPQQGFSSIGWLDSQGDVISSEYHFKDNNVQPGVVYYYRIKQIDLDQKYSYSSIEQAMIETEELLVTLSPNPVTENLSVSMMKENYHSGLMIVQDIMGRTLQTRAFELEDEAVLQLNTSNLPAGVYFLNISLDGKENLVEKFIKK